MWKLEETGIMLLQFCLLAFAGLITKKTYQDIIPDASLPVVCAYHESLNQIIVPLLSGLPKLKLQADKVTWILNQQEKFPELMEAVSSYCSSNAGGDYISPQEDAPRVAIPIPPRCILQHYGAYYKSACAFIDFWSNYLETAGQFVDETLRFFHLKFPYIVENYPGPTSDTRDFSTIMQIVMNRLNIE